MTYFTYREPVFEGAELLLIAASSARTAADKQEARHIYRTLGDQKCLEIAERNQVVPLVAELLCSVGGGVEHHWRERLSNNASRVGALLEACLRGLQCLELEGCRPTVIEGGATLLAHDMPLDTFGARDIDVLVDPLRWHDAAAILEGAGFRPGKRQNATTIRRSFFSVDARGTRHWIELAPTPFERAWTPLPHEDPTPAWLDRRVESRLYPEARVLELHDSVVMGAMHASLHYFVRAPGLRLYLDLDRPARSAEIDWNEVGRRITGLGPRRRCFASLIVSRSLLGTPVPDDVLSRAPFSGLRWGGVQRILETEGVLVGKQPKLGRLKTVLLDALVSDEPLPQWFEGLLFPPDEWLQRRIHGKGGKVELGAARAVAAARRWCPR